MLTLTASFAVVALIFLAFASTRWVGALGLVLLLYLYPLVVGSALVVAGVIFFLIHHHNRRSVHELPNLPDARD